VSVCESNKWFSLIDKVSSDRTLAIGWKKVKSNAGSCGVDGITVGTFAKDSEKRLLAVKEHIKQGTYQAKPIKRVYIPKAGSSEKRPLGIPTVTDRVVQAAVKLVIEPIFEREFAANSYGFRPGRGCKDALREVERLLREGNCHVVDVDIKGYFDNIAHAPLMELVKDRIADGKVLSLIEKFLKQGVLEEGIITDSETGSPQGGIISPLLANIYLDPLDKLLEQLGLQSVRYADDIIVLAKSVDTARNALVEIENWMKGMELQLHPEKTRIVDMNEGKAYFDFLGYRFKRSKKGKLLKLVRPKSKQKLRSSIRKLTKRCNSQSMGNIIDQVNLNLQGWYGYFKHSHSNQMGPLDAWIRMRLRSILRKRLKGKGKGRGLDHFLWPNYYFENLGLMSLVKAQKEEKSLCKRVKR